MQLTFLGKSTQGGGSPTLYLTDRETYVVQGWRVPGEPSTTVEIPESLLRHLQPGTELETSLRSTGRRWHGDDGDWDTFTVAGAPVTSPDTLSQMNIPGHEACIEVRRKRKGGGNATTAGPGL